MRRKSHENRDKDLARLTVMFDIFMARWLVDKWLGKEEAATSAMHPGATLVGKHLYTSLNTMTSPLKTLRPDGEDPAPGKEGGR